MSFGQQLNLQAEPDSLSQTNYFDLNKDFESETDLRMYLSQKLDSLRKVGYLAASVDSVFTQDSLTLIQLYLGEKLDRYSIANGNIDSLIFDEFIPDGTMSWDEVSIFKQNILNEYLEKGFIDTEVYLDHFQYFHDEIKASIFVHRGNEYFLDSIITKGDVVISPEYLNRFLNIEKGTKITKSFLESLNLRAGQSSFFEFSQDASFRLKDEGLADLYLYLQEKKANQFDLLLGFLPNPNPRLTDQNFLVTGDGNLLLLNPFGGGREISIDYKQLQPESPIIAASTYLPSLLRQKFGARGAFNLEKQDSSFINLNYRIGLNYQFEGNKHLSLNYRAQTSYLQNVDTNLVKLTKNLPASSDFDQQLYSLEFINHNLNSNVAPTKGFSIKTEFGAGNRTIDPNEKVLAINDGSGFDYATLYQTVNENKLTIQGNSTISYFIPIKRMSTIHLKNFSGYKKYDLYFENDLYRLGGINSIRGFDERSYLASAFSINTAEYRLLLNRESYFSIFSDFGYVENKRIEENDFLLGLGTGLDLSTKAGIFSINLAVGKDRENPFDLNRSRIHFGYVNIF